MGLRVAYVWQSTCTNNGLLLATMEFRITMAGSIFLLASAQAVDFESSRLHQAMTEVLGRVRTENEVASVRTAAQQSLTAKQPSGVSSINPSVQRFVDYYQGSARAFWNSSTSRLGASREGFEKVFESEGVPKNLIWLGLVESGFQPQARSPKQAVGMWQLIPSTAERFGLRVSGNLDDRLDPMMSARAAARYLKFLHDRFQDWPLSLAAYNAGEARVQAALAKAERKNVWALIDSGLLPEETRAYVPAVLAAQALASDNRDRTDNKQNGDHHDEPQPASGILFAPARLSDNTHSP